MNDQELSKETMQMLCTNLEDQSPELLKCTDFDAFRNALIMLTRNLLYNDYNRLLNILYRMDVNEKKYTQLFKDYPSDKISEALADLMIERAKQKVETRRKYKGI